MNWSHVAFENCIPILTLVAAWFAVKWLRLARKNAFTLRDWLGAVAFWLGVLSTLAYAYLYAYYWVTRELLFTSGLSLYYSNEIGLMTALSGVLIGFVGRGWVRGASVFISTAIAFQWLSLFFPSRFENLIVGVMLATLAAETLLWFGPHLLLRWMKARRLPKSDIVVV